MTEVKFEKIKKLKIIESIIEEDLQLESDGELGLKLLTVFSVIVIIFHILNNEYVTLIGSLFVLFCSFVMLILCVMGTKRIKKEIRCAEIIRQEINSYEKSYIKK